jgi:hypothetical protein
MLQYIDKNRNCEDLAMAHIMASLSQAPPVWIKATVHEIADFGISSGSDHFLDRFVRIKYLRIIIIMNVLPGENA